MSEKTHGKWEKTKQVLLHPHQSTFWKLLYHSIYIRYLRDRSTYWTEKWNLIRFIATLDSFVINIFSVAPPVAHFSVLPYACCGVRDSKGLWFCFFFTLQPDFSNPQWNQNNVPSFWSMMYNPNYGYSRQRLSLVRRVTLPLFKWTYLWQCGD